MRHLKRLHSWKGMLRGLFDEHLIVQEEVDELVSLDSRFQEVCRQYRIGYQDAWLEAPTRAVSTGV